MHIDNYSRPSVIRPLFIRNLGIENDCFIRVFRVYVCVNRVFKGALYVNVLASIIWIIHLSEVEVDHFIVSWEQRGSGLLYVFGYIQVLDPLHVHWP